MKQREEESGVQGGEGVRKTAGMRKKRDSIKNLEVLMFLIKSLATSVCSRFSYLATIILFSAEVPDSRCCCFFLRLSVRLSTYRGGVGVQDVETSEWV